MAGGENYAVLTCRWCRGFSFVDGPNPRQVFGGVVCPRCNGMGLVMVRYAGPLVSYLNMGDVIRGKQEKAPAPGEPASE